MSERDSVKRDMTGSTNSLLPPDQLEPKGRFNLIFKLSS